MPCCQISISHGRFCGLRIIFAMAAEHLNPADSLREMKCCADGALLPRGPAQLRTQPGADPPPQPAWPGRAASPPVAPNTREARAAGGGWPCGTPTAALGAEGPSGLGGDQVPCGHAASSQRVPCSRWTACDGPYCPRFPAGFCV